MQKIKLDLIYGGDIICVEEVYKGSFYFGRELYSTKEELEEIEMFKRVYKLLKNNRFLLSKSSYVIKEKESDIATFVAINMSEMFRKHDFLYTALRNSFKDHDLIVFDRMFDDCKPYSISYN